MATTKQTKSNKAGNSFKIITNLPDYNEYDYKENARAEEVKRSVSLLSRLEYKVALIWPCVDPAPCI